MSIMLKCIVLHCIRHPFYYLYLLLIICSGASVILFTCTRDMGIVIKEDFQTKLPMAPNKRNIIRDEDSPFQQDRISWIKERVAKLNKEFFKSRISDEFKSREAIPMFIIEEHHGVIPYWYGSADAGILPHKSGNTLVHIDAHSDFGNPDFGPSFPLFRWPKTHELIQLMQENDRFIVSACLTGMFSRAIWIYPDWDPTILEKDDVYAPHIIINVQLGLEISPKHNTQQAMKGDGNRLCACLSPLNLTRRNDDTTQEFGFHNFCVSVKNGSEEIQEELIQKSQCSLLENKTLTLEAVRESTFIDLIMRKDSSLKPLSIGDSWILDIDEDYFGVEAPVQPLYNTNVSDEMIDDLSIWISKIFCTKSADVELNIDFIFQKIIQFVRVHREEEGCQNLKDMINSYDDDDVMESPNIRHLSYEKELGYQVDCGTEVLKNDFIFHSNVPRNKRQRFQYSKHIFCHFDTELELRVRIGALLSLLYRMNDHQLESLAEVGICLWSSIPYNENRAFRLKVCDGFNRPNDESMVAFYTPNDVDDLENRAVKMTEIIKFFSTTKTSAKDAAAALIYNSGRKPPVHPGFIPPALITLVRSARDGFVPRSLVSQIESLVVKSVKDLYSNKGMSVKKFYDVDLFGGVGGWNENRYRLKDFY